MIRFKRALIFYKSNLMNHQTQLLSSVSDSFKSLPLTWVTDATFYSQKQQRQQWILVKFKNIYI